MPISSGTSEQLVLDHRDSLLERGSYLFCCSNSTLRANEWLGLIPTTRYQDVLLALQTNGANYDHSPKDVVDWLDALQETYPFVMTGAGFDWCRGKFSKKVTAPTRLAKMLYEFCPDVVEQGCGTVKALGDELKKNQGFFLWWD